MSPMLGVHPKAFFALVMGLGLAPSPHLGALRPYRAT